MKYLLAFIIACSILITAQAQTTFNIELQAYPTGFIPGIRLENQISGKTKIHLRLGMNIFDHRDLGVHDEETGQGFGFTFGAARRLKNPKFELGLRNDVWFNTVDWRDYGFVPISYGQTDIIVLQPTAELTYRIDVKKISIRPSLAFGLEWNVKTEGEPTGEGPILLLGVIIGKKAPFDWSSK